MIKSKFSINIKRIKRSFLIWKTLFLLLINLWFDRLFSKLFMRDLNKQENIQRIRAKWFTGELIKLGSAFIKIGQLLSARPDLIPKTWINELSTLQDSVPQFPFETVENIIQTELQEKFKNIKNIERIPIGSASLAQVHKAVLVSDKSVVFKVQRPNLKILFNIDLDIMQQIAFLLQKNRNWSRGRDWVEIARECRKVLLRELDFNCEAQYAARFRQQFLDDPNIEIPEVIWDMSTERVLCLSYLKGTKISNIDELQSQKNPHSQCYGGRCSYLPKIAQLYGLSRRRKYDR